MSVFGTIMSKIFHHPKAQSAGASGQAPAPAQTTQPQSPAAAAQPAPEVDVEGVLQAMADDSGQTLDWRHSIVDLLKLLAIDPSLANRKALAGELGYSGDTSDSAAMNIWLHRAVMQKLAENGCMVPDSLR